ncbi:glycoside hydrolase family 9 protein [Microbacterium hydrothermale]|uniref:glycoside hydrolase family 9 protein n=1 Tax=Microbacterium hydrothermale TaxID=857427 RepID=UPI002226223C|nr:glycoside hydrolase family 9 protein [Microbacterium hydrothermale]
MTRDGRQHGTVHYDLTGGWYDAGDYGIYGGNQWVGGNIAISYLRYGNTPAVAFDNGTNGVPDLVDEARFGSEYLLRMLDAFDGAFWDVKGSGGFQHSDKHTAGIVGTIEGSSSITCSGTPDTSLGHEISDSGRN